MPWCHPGGSLWGFCEINAYEGLRLLAQPCTQISHISTSHSLEVPGCPRQLLLRAWALPCLVQSPQGGAAGICGWKSSLGLSQGVPVLVHPPFLPYL